MHLTRKPRDLRGGGGRISRSCFREESSVLLHEERIKTNEGKGPDSRMPVVGGKKKIKATATSSLRLGQAGPGASPPKNPRKGFVAIEGKRATETSIGSTKRESE